ncbi:MAG: hypothetical protein KIS78_05065 [Labilithrix sp.]|nr:hypothetical protein [Labilithrix sp.]
MGSGSPLRWVAIAGVTIAACGRVLEPDEPSSLPDGGRDASLADAPPPVDGAPSETAPSSAPCSRAPSCPFSAPSSADPACRRTRLYEPAQVEFPHGIATSSGYVFWSSQIAADSEDVPYDGRGAARILRVSKAGGPDQDAFVVAHDQRNVRVVTATRSHVYWAAETEPARFHVIEAAVDCEVSPCEARVVHRVQQGHVPERLVALDEGTLLLMADNMVQLVPVAASTPTGAPLRPLPDAFLFPNVARTQEDVFVASVADAELLRLDRAAVSPSLVPFASLPTGDAGHPPGPAAIAGTCDRLWAVDERSELFELSEDRATLITTALPPGSWFDAVGDARYVYFGRANGGGVLAYDTQERAVSELFSGSAWHIAVDDDGIYIGDHGDGPKSTYAGAIHVIAKD